MTLLYAYAIVSVFFAGFALATWHYGENDSVADGFAMVFSAIILWPYYLVKATIETIQDPTNNKGR